MPSNEALIAQILRTEPTGNEWPYMEGRYSVEGTAPERNLEKQRIIASLLRDPDPSALAEGLGMDAMDSRDPRTVMYQEQTATDPRGQYTQGFQEAQDMRRMAERAGYPTAGKKEIDYISDLPAWFTNFDPMLYRE